MPKTYEDIKSTNIERFRNGNFDGLRLYYLFENQMYDEIDAVLEGLAVNADSTVLHMLVLIAHRIYLSPKAEDLSDTAIKNLKNRVKDVNHETNALWGMDRDETVSFWNEEIRLQMEQILCRTIAIIGKNKETCYNKDYFELLENHFSEKVRLYYCANIEFVPFLDDPSFRISHVAALLKDFYNRYFIYDPDRVKQINFIVGALRTGAIEVCAGRKRSEDSSAMFANFYSPFFRKTISNVPFDKDIVYTISDKRILADAILEYVSEGKIVFHPNILPSYFESALPREEEPSTGGKKHK